MHMHTCACRCMYAVFRARTHARTYISWLGRYDGMAHTLSRLCVLAHHPLHLCTKNNLSPPTTPFSSKLFVASNMRPPHTICCLSTHTPFAWSKRAISKTRAVRGRKKVGFSDGQQNSRQLCESRYNLHLDFPLLICVP
eukprot:GDKI01016584.1.p2 GENE.GDKI01016584.1~~GDKI01016584.1.p2  ORF type:complete len:156 (-),score=22.01 GDKI01016584.1:32-448(-)